MKQRLRSLGLLLLASAAAGFWAMLLELLKAQRLAEYEGVWPEMYPAWGAALLTYSGAIACACLALRKGVARIFPRAVMDSVLVYSAFLAGALIWLGVAMLQRDVNSLYVVLIPPSFLLPLIPVLLWRRITSGSLWPALAFVVVLQALLIAGIGGELHTGRTTIRPTPTNSPITIFIVADALRVDVCSTYGGSVPTPNLARLASEGILFQHAHAPAPWTLPSIYSIAAGAYRPLPDNGVPRGDAGDWLPGMEHGAVALVGNWLLGGADGFTASFERRGSVTVLNSLQAEHKGPWPLTPFLQHALLRMGVLNQEARPLDTSRVLMRKLKQAFTRGNQIGALYLHLMDPHDPYAPPSAFTSPKLRGRFFSPSPARDWGGKQLDEERRIDLKEGERQMARALYEAEVRYVDACLGVVLDTLQVVESNDSSVRWRIVFTADHGEEFWDHGGFYHGHTLYQEQLHVPLIVAGSGVATGVVSERVSLTSLVPSLRGLDGEAGGPLTETLRSGVAPEASPVFAYATVPVASVLHDVAVIQGDYKLILHRDGHTMELYNLSADPREQHNLVQEEPLRAAELHRLLETWKAGTPLHEDETDSREATERLEALGYL